MKPTWDVTKKSGLKKFEKDMTKIIEQKAEAVLEEKSAKSTVFCPKCSARVFLSENGVCPVCKNKVL